MHTENWDTQMDDQKEDHSNPKIPLQKNCPKQLETHNVPTDDVENTHSTNIGRRSTTHW